ncbi:MAG TPA: oligosaccharide flippase family protein [Candidatus Brocadiia bacterium]|nr:oligosaccharide flippase family protein [Candidatus Brocadiales bacterium]
MDILNNNTQKTMDNAVKSAKDVTKTLGSFITCTTFSFFYFIIISRLLSPLELSVIAIWFVFNGISVMLTGLGFNPTCMQKVPELFVKGEKKEGMGLIKTSFLSQFIIVSFLALTLNLSAPFISQVFFKTTDFAIFIKIISFAMVSGKLKDLFYTLFSVTRQFGKISIIGIVDSIFVRLMALIPLFFFGFTGYLIALLIGEVLINILQIFLLRDLLFMRTKFYSFRKLFSYSYPYWIGELVRGATIHADQLVVGIFLAPEKLAVYYVAKRFFDPLISYSNLLLNPTIPTLSEIKVNGTIALERAFKKVSRYLSFALIPPCLFAASLSYPLLHLFGAGKYLDGLPLTVILSLSVILYGINTAYSSTVFISGKPKDRLKLIIFEAFLTVSTTFTFLNLFGLLGVAVARFFSLLGSLLFARYSLAKLNASRFDISALKRTLLVSIIAVCIVCGLQILWYDNLLIPLYALVGVVFFLVLFSRNLSKEDITLLESFLPQRLKKLAKIPYFFGACKKEDIVITSP